MQPHGIEFTNPTWVCAGVYQTLAGHDAAAVAHVTSPLPLVAPLSMESKPPEQSECPCTPTPPLQCNDFHMCCGHGAQVSYAKP